MKADDDLYIGIEDPLKIRRSLLESTKSLIHVLQANERLRMKRQERQELTNQLKDTISELYTLLAHVRGEMPHVPASQLPKTTKKAQKEPEPEIIKTKKTLPTQLSTSDLARELDEIEKKLGSLR